MGLVKHQLQAFLKAGPAIDVQITKVKGSSPRDVGAWMLVNAHEMIGTIGGGQLEFMMIDEARKMLRLGHHQLTCTVPLGPEIGQCCGGQVEIALSMIANPKDILIRHFAEQNAKSDVLIFGAGHMGKALAQTLALLPLNPVLIDQRAHELPNISGVENRLSPLPEAELRTAKPGSAVVVLTHDHALDFLIAGEALALGKFSYVGMIGSKTKRGVFSNWLKQTYDGGVDAKNLVCPIGGLRVQDKRPEIIAALVAAEIIATLDQAGQLAKNTLVRGEEHAR
ncbi:xanthine dehydrogenase accessory protein XdhC [Maritalea porphyrae]|uniref:xanthine dehydrogenase accessory protein XdhC n=1 Tax=Maritalea porphyrae TaxID=880732 RepID=UPI0022AEB048|nr:xanthine dehydrogenase accessory protein XdhC [Maritalea porphyrae]MCZ4272108.1 xanthine dehydrogenase accessory protein XdhC [Maritalea porphyrae]